VGFKGFFVDIGAHHPIRFSNTYDLYRNGWRGLNIDAMPGSMKAFQEYRPADQNVEIGISEKQGVLKYFMFNESALNTFSVDEASRKAGKDGFYIVKTIDVEVAPLSNVLDRYLPANTYIDYLNIDAEGLDMQVLRSNNWQKYRPSLIAVESHYSEGPIQNSEIYRYLTDLDYTLISVLFNTLFFAKSDSSVHSELRL
jgi:FkbM family methyltransferase